MYQGSIGHDRILEAFRRCVPDCFVRDYRDRDGYITVAKGLKDIRWRDQASGGNVYRQVPIETLVSIPRGSVRAATQYAGITLVRPGWREQFRKAMVYMTHVQMKAITKFLGVGEVFPGIV